jgi:O-antigen/teichoic acid export membrane protein
VTDTPITHEEQASDILLSPEAGHRVLKGGILRVSGYAAGTLLTALASILLLRYLGVDRFGQYVTVMALIAIATGISDAGLGVVGTRELSSTPPGPQRRALLANLFGIRLVLTPIVVLIAIAFAAIAGYPSVMVEGTALAGVGLVLIAGQATLMIMLTVELRNERLSLAEVVRQGLIAAAIALLVITHAPLLAFFASQIAVGIVMVASSRWLLGPNWWVRPSISRGTWKSLLLESAPLAVAYALALIYFRVLLILLSLNGTEHETGIFGTSLRIFEMLLGIPTLAIGVALPVLSASVASRERLHYQVQRLTDTSIVVATTVAVLGALAAKPIIQILGGSKYQDAAGVLQIHLFAFIPVFVANVWTLTLIALGRQKVLVIVNLIALPVLLGLGLALTPSHGAKGAAIASVISEVVLASMVLFVLSRQPQHPRPALWTAVKMAVAAGIALGVAWGLGLAPIPATAVGGVLLIGTAFALRAVPDELIHFVRHRGAGP